MHPPQWDSITSRCCNRFDILLLPQEVLAHDAINWRDSAQDIKQLVEQLKAQNRD
jgi:hypothetical protein